MGAFRDRGVKTGRPAGAFLALVLLLSWALPAPVQAQGHRSSSQETPEKTISRYIQALREGDPEGVRAVSYPSETAFYLPGPVNIIRYRIRDKRILRAGDLGGLKLRVTPQEGDIQLDVFQVREMEGERTYHMFSYWLRLIEDEWKIYARSVWGGP